MICLLIRSSFTHVNPIWPRTRLAQGGQVDWVAVKTLLAFIQDVSSHPTVHSGALVSVHNPSLSLFERFLRVAILPLM